MSTLTITIKPNKNRRTFSIEMDADRFERMAGDLGLFNQDFLKSLDRAERDITQGKTRRLYSLKDLRHA